MIDLSWLAHFQFNYPWVFLLALPLLALWWWQQRRAHGDNPWKKHVDAHLLSFLLQSDKPLSRTRRFAPLFLWLMALVALAGPTVIRPHETQAFAQQSSRVLLLDLTPSMNADDVKPTRLARAKLKALDWLKQQPEGQTALVVYSGSAHIVVPFSNDTRTLAALIPSLETHLPPIVGNDPVQAFQLIEKMRRDNQLARVDVVWITDGFDHDQADALHQSLQSSALRLSVLGIGTEAGAPVRRNDGQLLTDSKGQVVLAKTNHLDLMQWAQRNDARYSSLQGDGGDLEALRFPLTINDDLKSAEQISLQSFDLGAWVCLMLLPLALWSLRHARLWLLLLGFGLHAPRSDASWWDDLWQTRNQQARQLFNEKKNAQAAELFTDPQWRAAAQYRDGQFNPAASGFGEQRDADSLFNQANALAYAQRYNEAEHAFESALKHNPTHNKAKENLAALREFLKKADQQKKRDDQNKNAQNQQQGKQQNPPQSNNENQADQSSANNGQKEGQQQASPRNANQSPDQTGQDASSPEQRAQQDADNALSENDKKISDKKDRDNKNVQDSDEQSKPPELDPQVQAMLRQLPDDPAGLLRRRMKLELLRRGQTEPEPSTQDKW